MSKLFISCIFFGGILIANCKSNQPGYAASSTLAKTGDINSRIELYADTGLQETYWRLTEIMGKSISPPPADKREIHIRLLKDGNQLQGFAGCNTIGGTYELKDGNQIFFTNVLGTLMACPDIETENALLEVLKATNSYKLNGNQLALTDGKTETLARFEAKTIK
jgi:heat shock protein HslJ